MDPKAPANSTKSARNLGPTVKTPSKLELNRKDSGYISSSPTPATSSTEGTVIRRSLSGANNRGPTKGAGSSGGSSPETDLESPLQIQSSEQPLTLKLADLSDPESTMQRTLKVSALRTYEEELPAEVSCYICVRACVYVFTCVLGCVCTCVPVYLCVCAN